MFLGATVGIALHRFAVGPAEEPEKKGDNCKNEQSMVQQKTPPLWVEV